MKISRRTVMAGLGLGPAALRADLSAGPRTFPRSAELDAVIEDAIREDRIPGATLAIGYRGEIVHAKAYGFRALEPRREPMTLDTVFDIASLTKVIATTPALMRLFEQGKLRLNDPVSRYLPEFEGGKSPVTVRNLLTHFSGLRPDLDTEPAWSGYETGIHKALAEVPSAPPGARFAYSDINFILLGEIVRRLSGRSLAEYAREIVFAPLGMQDTGFLPAPALLSRIAPTERIGGRLLRGVVHDDTARFMGGVAGHSGVFSTASDLCRFAFLMLNGGELGGVKLFEPLTQRKFTTPQSPPDQPVLRGLGWDIDSPLSGNRGELFPLGSYGHTGFTGTSLWIDPASRSFVLLLANSVHPHRRPAITALRGRLATVAAAALGVETPGVTLTGYNETLIGAGVHRVVARNAATLTGLDVLAEKKFAPLAGRSIGLITNQTGLDREGRRNVELMLGAGVRLTALFSPEHGPQGGDDRTGIGHSRDAATGLPVWSLFGDTLRPTPEMLDGLDALVFDIQDAGARFYTYITTMAYAIEAAAARHVPFFALDRPNPITGTHVEGPLLDPDLRSFTGYLAGLPLRHGMTVGELAPLFNARNGIGAEIHVIPMRNWQRGDWFDSTGLPWTDPSPNLRSLTAALLYPGVALLEYSEDYSVGRGTDAPFEQIGAEWIDGPALASRLNAQFIPGVRVYPVRFRPESSRLAGRWLGGVRFLITDREAFDSGRLGLEIAAALRSLYPRQLTLAPNLKLIGNRRAIERIEGGASAQAIQQQGEEALAAFLKLREPHLLYR